MIEIKQEWIIPKYNLIVTTDKKVLTKDLTECVEEVHQGQLKFRIPKTGVRVSKRYIRKNAIKQIKIIQQYTPF